MGSIIYLIEPISHLIPTVPKPIHPIKPNEKLVWTGMVLFIYLIYSQIPIYGIYKTQDSDPLHYMRAIIASSRGTLAELGISPVLGSSYLLSILRTLRIIKFDASIAQDRILYEHSVKFIAIIITIGEAITLLMRGVYGPVNLIGPFNSILIVSQLVMGGIIIIILDDLLSNGYGFMSGISLFISTNISESLMMKAFSPFTLASERGIEYEGAIISFFHLLIIKKNKIEALKLAFFRKSAPNLMQLILTLIILLIVIYLWRFKIDLKVVRKTVPGETHQIPIKLFYSSTTPIIIINIFISNIYRISQVLYNRHSDSFLIKLLGTWAYKDGEQIPISGIAYFLTPPKNLLSFIMQPLKSIVYVTIIFYCSGYSSSLMAEVSGKGPIDMARNLKNQGFFLDGLKDNNETIYQKLNKLIPTVAFLSGMFISGIKILADLTGAFGTGTGILILVSNILEVQENNELKSNEGNTNVFLEG